VPAGTEHAIERFDVLCSKNQPAVFAVVSTSESEGRVFCAQELLWNHDENRQMIQIPFSLPSHISYHGPERSTADHRRPRRPTNR
jgi:hypothetical protein